MEDGKFWPALIMLALAVGGIFAFRYFEMYDKANSAAIDARSAVNIATEALNLRKEMWGRVGTLIQEVAEANERHQKAQGEADTKERLVTGDLAYLTKAMKEKVASVRMEAANTEIAAVSLRNGKNLRNARIMKVDDTSATFLHSDGITTVAVGDLPAELVEKFDLGSSSLTGQLLQLEASLQKPVESPSTKPEEPQTQPSITTTVTDPSIKAHKIKTIKLKIVDLDSQISLWKKSAAQYRSEAIHHQSLAQTAKSRGIPSAKHTADASKLLSQANQAEQQAAYLGAEKSKLSVELNFVSTSK